MSNFSSRLRLLRKNQGLNVSAFAQKAAVNRTYVSDIEAGRGEPSRNFLQALHDAFGVSYDWLFTGEGEMFIKEKAEPIDTNTTTEVIDELTSDPRKFAAAALIAGMNDDQLRKSFDFLQDQQQLAEFKKAKGA